MAISLMSGAPPQDVMMKRKHDNGPSARHKQHARVVEDVGVVNGHHDMVKNEKQVIGSTAQHGSQVRAQGTPEPKPRTFGPVKTEGTRGDVRVAKSAPPGWAGTVEHMKEKGDIKNPFALSWYMKKKGYKPHYADVKKAGIPGCAMCLKGAFDAGMMKGGHVLVADLYYQDAAGHVYYMPDSLFKAAGPDYDSEVRSATEHQKKHGRLPEGLSAEAFKRIGTRQDPKAPGSRGGKYHHTKTGRIRRRLTQ